jgi:hypothetical protein
MDAGWMTDTNVQIIDQTDLDASNNRN